MLSLSYQPPANIRADLELLMTSLNQSIPPKVNAQNLLIATWNIRTFGSLTREWTAGNNDSPKRDLRGLRAICEIASRFDIIAIQEAVGNLRALREMMNFLGNDWAFLMTDVTLGSAGNNERMAFIFDTRRVQPSGLACELVVPPEWENAISPNALQNQFARTPYAVSFRTGTTTFILVALHIDYGNQSADRIPELQTIARWMAEWASRSNRWHHNLLTLGDFNIDRRNDRLWQAFTSTGLTVPDDLNEVRRSIFDNPNQPSLNKFYDQIAWFQSGSRSRRLSMNYLRGGGFDFLPYVYTDTNLNRRSISYRISDHYPLWVEFEL